MGYPITGSQSPGPTQPNQTKVDASSPLPLDTIFCQSVGFESEQLTKSITMYETICLKFFFVTVAMPL